MITLSISIVALFIGWVNQFWPVIDWLCFDYQAIREQGEYWRLITAHLVHSSTDHLFWDLLVFVFCGYYLEQRQVRLYVLTLIVSFINLNLYLLSPLASVLQYSGLSGILYAVMTVAAIEWLNTQKGMSGWLPILLIIFKTIMELTQAQSVFVTEGWALDCRSHLAGAISGLLVILSVRVTAWRM